MQNPLIVWELIHLVVETLNSAFERVSELDIMINLELVRGRGVGVDGGGDA